MSDTSITYIHVRPKILLTQNNHHLEKLTIKDVNYHKLINKLFKSTIIRKKYKYMNINDEE